MSAKPMFLGGPTLLRTPEVQEQDEIRVIKHVPVPKRRINGWPITLMYPYIGDNVPTRAKLRIPNL